MMLTGFGYGDWLSLNRIMGSIKMYSLYREAYNIFFSLSSYSRRSGILYTKGYGILIIGRTVKKALMFCFCCLLFNDNNNKYCCGVFGFFC